MRAANARKTGARRCRAPLSSSPPVPRQHTPAVASYAPENTHVVVCLPSPFRIFSATSYHLSHCIVVVVISQHQGGMLRRTCARGFLAPTAVARKWVAEEDDANAPDTTFKNVKPNLFLRWWRQVRLRVVMLWVIDEEMDSLIQESWTMTDRMEQIAYAPSGAYGSVPGSYSDPLMYNTKSTSPFRWHGSDVNHDVEGHWYMDFDDIWRLKEWQPKTDDPFEFFPRPPNMGLAMEETIDEHGNRHFKYRYKYDVYDFVGAAVDHHDLGHLYTNVQQSAEKVEPFGFKQGELLRCNAEEEKILRRVMEEEDKEWEMVKQTEIIQEPWMYPGKIRTTDFHDELKRAKQKWRDQVKAGQPTNPEKNPNYDFVKAGEMVEPKDGKRAEWRHLWLESRAKGGSEEQQYSVTYNDGFTWAAEDAKLPSYPPHPTLGRDGKGGGLTDKERAAKEKLEQTKPKSFFNPPQGLAPKGTSGNEPPESHRENLPQ